jgi:hypothetical protein
MSGHVHDTLCTLGEVETPTPSPSAIRGRQRWCRLCARSVGLCAMGHIQPCSHNGAAVTRLRTAGIVARVVALIWAGFFVVFDTLLGFVEGDGGPGPLVHALPGLVFAAGAVLAWRHPSAGGAVLLGIGLCVIAFVSFWVVSTSGPMSTMVFSLVMMALPSLMAGALLILVSLLTRIAAGSMETLDGIQLDRR